MEITPQEIEDMAVAAAIRAAKAEVEEAAEKAAEAAARKVTMTPEEISHMVAAQAHRVLRASELCHSRHPGYGRTALRSVLAAGQIRDRGPDPESGLGSGLNTWAQRGPRATMVRALVGRKWPETVA